MQKHSSITREGVKISYDISIHPPTPHTYATVLIFFLFFLAATKSVRLSHLFHYVPIMISSWNFQVLLPMADVRSMQNVRGQRSSSQSSKTQLSRFRIVTPVWIHIWWWNDAQSLMLLMRGALFFLMSSVKCQDHTAKKYSILIKIGRFRTVTPL